MKYVSLNAGFSGCVGQSRNPAVSEQILTKLRQSATENDQPPHSGFVEHGVDVSKKVSVCFKGDLAFPHPKFSGQNITETIYNMAVSKEYTAGFDYSTPINYCSKPISVAIAEEDSGKSEAVLYLMQSQVPIYVIDERRTLNQIFFVSKPQMWREAIENLPMKVALEYFKESVVIEMPEDHVWQLGYAEQNEEYVCKPDEKFDLTKAGWAVKKFKFVRTWFHELV
jgi:hypothetical protein